MFLFVAFFLLINVFLAIIVDAYVEVKNKSEGSDSFPEELMKMIGIVIAERKPNVKELKKTIMRLAGGRQGALWRPRLAPLLGTADCSLPRHSRLLSPSPQLLHGTALAPDCAVCVLCVAL